MVFKSSGGCRISFRISSFFMFLGEGFQVTPLETRLAEIKQRMGKATPGPWLRREGDSWWDIRGPNESAVISCGQEGEVTVGYEDAEFIAHSRADIEMLVKALECAATALQSINCHAEERDDYEGTKALEELNRLAGEGK